MQTQQVENYLPQSYQTSLEVEIQIAYCESYNRPRTAIERTTYGRFFHSLTQAADGSHEKNGRGFLIGPCHGHRRNSNMPFGCVAVIDADSHYTKDKEVVNGAPDLDEVHNALVKENISHFLYTTYSHLLPNKGQRYRVVFPVFLSNQTQLAAFLTYVIDILNNKYNIGLPLSRESSVWTQLWQLPRLRDEDAPFVTLQHVGEIPNPAYCETLYEFSSLTAPRLPSGNATDQLRYEDGSLMAAVERHVPIRKSLLRNNYEYVSEGFHRLGNGELVKVQRWRKPDSTSEPGVLVFKNPHGCDVLYSHHQTDPLAVGEGLTAARVYLILAGFDNQEEGLPYLLEEVHAEMAKELDDLHPVVRVAGNKIRFGNKFDEIDGDSSYRFMTWQDFQLDCANKAPVWVIEEADRENENRRLTSITVDKFWKSYRNRETYNGLVYKPTPIGVRHSSVVHKKHGAYKNIFHGWPLQPKSGSWDYLRWHLKYAICSGNEEHYEYILDWLAHLVQKPAEKPGVALVLKGPKGIGKSIIFEHLARLLGSNAIIIDKPKHLTGDFNIHLMNKLLVVVEEAYWSGDSQAEGPLKHLITDTKMTYEPKGMDSYQGESFCRVVMITNNDWAAPTTDDERRYCIPSVSNAAKLANQSTKHHPRGDFFPFLAQEMLHGGLEALLWDLMHRDISQANVRQAPNSEEMAGQYAQSLSGLEAWLFDSLSLGGLRMGNGVVRPCFGTQIPVDVIVESCSLYLNAHEKRRGISYKINALLQKRNPRTIRCLTSSSASTFYLFSDLVYCRKEYESTCGMTFWDA